MYKRQDHNNGDPSTIEIKIYHFSGAQAVAEDGYSDSWSLLGGCFIASAIHSSRAEPRLKETGKSHHATALGSLDDSMRTHGTLRAAASLWIAPVLHVRTMAHYKSPDWQAVILLLIVAFIAQRLVILRKSNKTHHSGMSQIRW